MLGVPEGVVWGPRQFMWLNHIKHHRDQLQGAPLSFSLHERATKDQQSREKTRSIEY